MCFVGGSLSCWRGAHEQRERKEVLFAESYFRLSAGDPQKRKTGDNSNTLRAGRMGGHTGSALHRFIGIGVMVEGDSQR